MSADRCPTCDREGCPRPAAVAAYQSSRADGDELAKAIAMIDAEGKCIAASMASRDARRRERAASMTRRIVGDAAKWRMVEPLIERLRDAAKVARHDCATEDEASQPATVGGLLATEADALLCRWYAAKQDAIGAFVDLENLRRPDPDDSWAGGIGRRDPMPGAEKRAADTKERLVDVTNKVIAAMTRGPIGEG